MTIWMLVLWALAAFGGAAHAHWDTTLIRIRCDLIAAYAQRDLDRLAAEAQARRPDYGAMADLNLANWWKRRMR